MGLYRQVVLAIIGRIIDIKDWSENFEHFSNRCVQPSERLICIAVQQVISLARRPVTDAKTRKFVSPRICLAEHIRQCVPKCPEGQMRE
jgi:hypothetical protein